MVGRMGSTNNVLMLTPLSSTPTDSGVQLDLSDRAGHEFQADPLRLNAIEHHQRDLVAVPMAMFCGTPNASRVW